MQDSDLQECTDQLKEAKKEIDILTIKNQLLEFKLTALENVLAEKAKHKQVFFDPNEGRVNFIHGLDVNGTKVQLDAYRYLNNFENTKLMLDN